MNCIKNIIIWQGSSEVKLSSLIGSYLVRILPYRLSPREWSKSMYFIFFAKAAKFKINKFGRSSIHNNKLLTYLNHLLKSLARFCTPLAARRSYCHDLRPIFQVRPLRSVSNKLFWNHLLGPLLVFVLLSLRYKFLLPRPQDNISSRLVTSYFNPRKIVS